MPISQTDQLFQLIKSLTKAEKRNFTLYARRIQSGDELKFLHLFEILDKQKELDEIELIGKLENIDKAKLSNLKRHLFKQILVSLRLIHIQKNQGIIIREHIDFANILYGKGLYLQSLKILDGARNMAEKHGFEMLDLEIIEYQKLIESRHITRSGTIKNAALIHDAKDKIDQLSNTILLSNLRLRMHDLYIRHGHIINDAELVQIHEQFKDEMPSFAHDSLGIFAKIYLYQSFVWYYYIQLDFVNCLAYSLKWVNVFQENPEFIDWDPDLYMRGYHYLLTSAYNLKDIPRFNIYLEELEAFRKSNYSKFNMNSKIISFLYVHTSRLNKHFLMGTFQEGIKDIPKTTRRITRYRTKLDSHRILVFYFKIAWMYFCNGQAETSIDYLNKIINLKAKNLREDLQGYSYLMLAMAHLEFQNYDIMGYLIRNAENYYSKMKQVSALQYIVLNFFKRLALLPSSEFDGVYKEFLEELEIHKNNPFEKRAFLYLDIYTWVKSKVEKKSMSQIIKEQNELSVEW